MTTTSKQSDSVNPILGDKIYATILDEVPVHIILTNVDGTILYANQAASKITGYAIDLMIGKTPSLWGMQMDSEYYKNMWETIKVSKKEFSGKINNRRKNGEIYIAYIKIVPLMNSSDLIGFIGIEQDITESENIENKLREANLTKDELISVVIHQMKTPVGAVRWNSEMLENGDFGELTPNVKKIVNQIYESNNRVLNMIDRFKAIREIEKDNANDSVNLHDISEIIEKAIDEQKADAKRLKVKVDLLLGDEKDCKLHVDFDRVFDVVSNLLSNAIKYSAKETGTVSVMVERQAKTIKVSFKDNGIGIPEDEQQNIFSKFYRSSNAKEMEIEGTGLGLYIVKTYVEEWGGEISFKSKKDHGTTFYFTIPLN